MEAMRNLMVQAAGLDAGSRLFRLDLPDLPAVVVDAWQGHDALSTGRHLQVDVLSLDAALPLADWLGQPASLYVRQADGHDWPRHGVIAAAQCLQADGGLVRYRITLRDWTWWLDQAVCSRVFQDQDVRAIVDAVLQTHAPHAHWRWSDDVDALLAASRPRSFCVQYRESDLAFVQRLLAEEGVGWCVEEVADAPAGHGVLLFADSTLLPESASSQARGGIRFHRADATEDDDGVQQLGQQRRLQSTRVQLHSSDYRSVSSLTGQLPLEGAGESLREDYDAVGAYAFADAAELQHHARLMAEAREAQALQWQGRGSVRSADAGHAWALTGLPGDLPAELLLVEVTHAGVNNLPVDLRECVQALLGEAAETDPLQDAAKRHGYVNAFSAVARDRRWRPILEDGTGARRNARPLAPGYQTAIVVAGASASNDLHADALGRIRVRFHFQGDDGGADSAWLRVAQRYAGPGVGSQFLPRIGQEVLVGFLEGDIDRPVVLGTLYNGRGEAGVAPTTAGASAEDDLSAYGQAADARNSAQANLSGGQAPAWHAAGSGDQAHRHGGALWGIRSREWEGGEGSNHLLFDDSNQQLRTQLASSQQVSQLTLGHLRHQADNYVGSLRGQGFELRSDAWGAVRGTAGAWFSAYAHAGASPAGEAVQPAALLRQLQTLGQRFAQAARVHVTSPLAMQEGATLPDSSQLDPGLSPLPGLVASVRTTTEGLEFDAGKAGASERTSDAGQNRVPHSGDPLLGFAAPHGVVHVAGQAVHWGSGEGLLLASGRHSDTVVMEQARLHARQAIGMLASVVEGAGAASAAFDVVAGSGLLDIQAQADQIQIQSRGGLHGSSAQAPVTLAAASTIHVATSGGASLSISDGNITIACPGIITVHAGRKSFVGPAQQGHPLPQFPRSSCKSCILDAMRQGTPGVLV